MEAIKWFYPPLKKGCLTKSTLLSQSDRTTVRLLSDLTTEHEKTALGILQSYVLRPLFMKTVEKWDSASITGHIVKLKKNNDEIGLVFVTDTNKNPMFLRYSK